MITLQLLVNEECPTILTFRRNSLDLLATTRVITCTCVRKCTKIKHFHVFLEFSVISVHRIYFTGGGGEYNFLWDSNLPPLY